MGKKETGKKISKKLLFAWPTRNISIGAATMLITYATFYATDILGLSASAIALMFVISKVFDGFTDFVAGAIIDKTNTKWGKGRPYELAIIGMWIFLALYFCAPHTSNTVAYIYLFVMYTMAYSIFSTFLNCNESVYLANALEDKSQSTTITAVSGLCATGIALVVGIVLPQLVATIGTTREGWRVISIILAVVFTVIGLIRFLVVKEIKQTGRKATEKLKVIEGVKLVFKNKYILLVAAVTFLGNILTSVGVGTYYYKYIMHDIGLASIMSLSLFSTIIAVALVPMLSKKITLRRTLQLLLMIGLVGYLIKLINLQSVPLLFLSNFLGTLASSLPIAFVAPLIIDCMDYGEWKNTERSEGMISCVSSITTKIGGAIGVGLGGFLLGLVHYNGTLEVQTVAVTNMIVAQCTILPACLAAILIVILQFYNLEDKIVEIRSDLKKRHKLDA